MSSEFHQSSTPLFASGIARMYLVSSTDSIKFQTFLANGQCKHRWSAVSGTWSHSTHIWLQGQFRAMSLSAVSILLWIRSQAKKIMLSLCLSSQNCSSLKRAIGKSLKIVATAPNIIMDQLCLVILFMLGFVSFFVSWSFVFSYLYSPKLYF
jgi:hypothetical protein